jgi:hypothetical protein
MILKCYSSSRALFGSQGDAAFKKIPAICGALSSRSSFNNRSRPQSALGRNGSGVARLVDERKGNKSEHAHFRDHEVDPGN